MRILLDECLPRRLKDHLSGHDVRTVPEMSWAGKENGELLGLAQERFEVFLTVDRNLSSEQDLSRFRIAVVVMSARSNRLIDLQPLLPELMRVLDAAPLGQAITIGR